MEKVNVTEYLSQIDIADDSNSCNSSSLEPFSNAGGEGMEPAGNFSNVNVSNSPRTSKRVSAAAALSLKKLSNEKFMENFDPEQSNRERRKLTRKICSRSGKKTTTVYDDSGLLGSAVLDLCDCMEEDCPGCHFPCPKCLSYKCGHECRQFRKWMYEEIMIEGTNQVITNPRFTK